MIAADETSRKEPGGVHMPAADLDSGSDQRDKELLIELHRATES